MAKVTKAVVMAGGEGSRLRPITSSRPKPLVPVCNRPIMEQILGLLVRHGIRDVTATVHYLADEIQGYFGDGSEFDCSISYSVEDTPLGTAGSVKKAEDELRGAPFLIISGDSLTDCDLSSAIEFHRSKGAVVTLVLSRVENPLEFGVVVTDPDGRVQRFLEKPSWSEVISDTVNTGIYIIEPEVLNLMQPNQNYDWSGDIFPALLREGKPIYGYVMDGYWADVGTLTQYREAQHHLLSGSVDLPIPGTEHSPGVYMGTGCEVEPGATLFPPLCLGNHCKVKSGAQVGPYTVVGDNALIEVGARIERSVLWDSAYVGANAHVSSAIVGSRVTLKMDVQVQEDAVIGDRCLIDVGSKIRPRVKLWPDKIIERGSTVTMSLIWGNRWRGNLFRDLGVAGLSNIEITPDFACRLGAAFGSCLPPPHRVVTSRDSTRSSRMIKRAIAAALLGVGCDVIDMRSTAVPIVRHFVRSIGAAGAVNVRKLPTNSRVTLVEMFDSRGTYLPRSLERKVENTFFREDFHRTDPDDLGSITYAARAIERYEHDFFEVLQPPETESKLRVVCDYGHTPLAALFPGMMSKLGIETISLNGANDSKLAPRTPEEIEAHTENLKQIVAKLHYDLGVLFFQEGERMAVVDSQGNAHSGTNLLAAMTTLVAQSENEPTFAISVTAPTRMESDLKSRGAHIIRTKADVRSLMNDALDAGVTMAGDDQGGFAFPDLHPGFDAMFAFAKLIAMLQKLRVSLADVATDLPQFRMAYSRVACPWEVKGLVMRRMAEDSQESNKVETVDGIKIFDADSWVLVIPDALEPYVHVYAETQDQDASDSLVGEYVRRIEGLVPQ
ncbi:MAG: mannose-1-phosphate guanyltransferase [Chthonomonadaceae bacterium]